MKKALLSTLLLFIAAVSFLSFMAEEQHQLVPGKGIDNEVILGQTTRTEVTLKYGDDFKLISHYIKKSDGSDTLYSVQQRYEKLGLSFYSKPGKDVFFAIHVRHPFNGVSDKGIVPDVSTMQDVVDKYGDVAWYSTGVTMIKQYDGIKFIVPVEAKYPISEKAKNKAIKMKVHEIVLFQE